MTEPKKPRKKSKTEAPQKQITPIVSAIGSNGALVETVFSQKDEKPRLAVWKDQHFSVVDSYSPDAQTRFVPHGNVAALVRHNVVCFADAPVEYGETQDLLDAIINYIHRYVDVPEAFERLAANYVLLTWVHDRFRELPYLRRRGDYGTGKTRFLTVLGSICFKPIFAGGASSTSPIFHLLDQIGGTLVIDEADFRFSDESALIAKILNSGNVKGYPVLRSESVNGRDFRPRAFKVFGPKIIGMRGRYDDPALESRFLTQTSSNPTLREDVPINLPSDQEAEASVLRDKLLLYRFRHFENFGDPKRLDVSGDTIEPRMHQILAPLVSVAVGEIDRDAILAHAQLAQQALQDARGQSVEAEVLAVVRKLMAESDGAGVSVKNIAEAHGRAFQQQAAKPLSPRAMGGLIRARLNLRTRKSHGVFIVGKENAGALDRLYARFGVGDEDVDSLRELLGEASQFHFGEKGEEGDDHSHGGA